MYIQRPTTTAFWSVLGAAALDWAQSEWQDSKNAGHARGSRNWQERMSNTSYQRAADDLQAAGLNRVLALGQGATTPSGAMSTVDKPSGVQTGIMAANAKSQIALQRAEENLVGQKTNESKSAEDLNRVAAVTNATQGSLNMANATSAAAQAKLLEEQARKVRLEADRGEVMNPFYEMGADLTKWLKSQLDSSAKSAKDGFWPTIKGGIKLGKEKAKEFFTDDPDKGWFDEGMKNPRKRPKFLDK